MNTQSLIKLIAILVCLLVVLVVVAVSTDPAKAPDDTLSGTKPPATAAPTPGSTKPQPTVPPVTDPTQSTLPTATFPPVTTDPNATQPPNNGGGDMIGSLYTRTELEAMDNTFNGYGPGTTSGGVRPSSPVSLTNEFLPYDTYFIGPDDHRVYLTFNCGYEQFTADGTPITGMILDTLKEKNVKGIFFLALHYCEANPDLVRRMIDEGHIVANHGARHKSMPKQSIDGMVKEIMELHNYVKDNFGYTMKYYRPASGEYSERVFAVAQSLGYTTLQYSFAYYDYDTANPPSDATALSTMQKRIHNGAIYQIHTVVESNANVLGDFIDYLRANGYEPAVFS